jgi:uncharacterized protein
MNTETKYERLQQALEGFGRVVIAYSGGTDSTFLLKTAIDVLGKENVLAFIALSPTFTQGELEEAKETAEALGARYLVVETDEMTDPRYIENSRNRCYYCKAHLFAMVSSVAEKEGFPFILEGSNLDDTADFRPGRKACAEYGIRSPLLDAGLKKEEIRTLSRTAGLLTHNKPSNACLASRIPYGTSITGHILGKIAKSEDVLRKLGFNRVRVRYHGDIARVEVPETSFDAILLHRKEIVGAFKELGFSYVALDLQGYRTGSMNEV